MTGNFQKCQSIYNCILFLFFFCTCATTLNAQEIITRTDDNTKNLIVENPDVKLGKMIWEEREKNYRVNYKTSDKELIIEYDTAGNYTRTLDCLEWKDAEPEVKSSFKSFNLDNQFKVSLFCLTNKPDNDKEYRIEAVNTYGESAIIYLGVDGKLKRYMIFDKSETNSSSITKSRN